MVGNHCTFEIACTREGTFNFWALEVTNLVESKLMLYFCRINLAEDRLSLNYRAPCSTSKKKCPELCINLLGLYDI